MHYIQAIGPFLRGLKDNWLWLMGLALMVEPLLDSLWEGYRERADRYISRKIRTRAAWTIAVFCAFVAIFLAFADQLQRTETAIGERNEARRQLAEKPSPPVPPPVATTKYVCSTAVTAKDPAHSAMLFEFGVRGFSTSGFAGAIAIDQPISSAISWQGAPLRTDIPPNMAALYTQSSEQIDGQVYRRSFASPNVTPQRSEYFYIEADKPFNVRGVLFLEDFDTLGDQVKANKLATTFDTCPR